jgi:hypothetical protein
MDQPFASSTPPPPTAAAKVRQVVVADMAALDAHAAAFEGHDVAFNCFGTTRKDAGSAVRPRRCG